MVQKIQMAMCEARDIKQIVIRSIVERDFQSLKKDCTVCIDFNGNRCQLQSFSESVSKTDCLVIAYRKNTMYQKAIDSRTQAQKNAILNEIMNIMLWLKDNGNDLQNVVCVGDNEGFEVCKEYSPVMEIYNNKYSKIKPNYDN